MALNDDSKEKIKKRLAKAIGHLNAVHRMVDEKRYCIDILTQLKAVQSALDRTAEQILKQHLDTCVVEAVKNDDSSRVMEELWQLLRKSDGSSIDPDITAAISPTGSSAASAVSPDSKKDCCA